MKNKLKKELVSSFRESELSPAADYQWKEAWTSNEVQESYFDNFKQKIFKVANYDAIQLSSPIDWSIDPFENRSWLFHYNKLSFLDGFVSYSNNNSISREHLSECTSAIESNYQFIKNAKNAGKYEFCWHDHTTASRASSVAQLYCFSKELLDQKEEQLLFNYISLHILFLKQDWFYSKHTNHGLDQAKALYIASSLLEDQEGMEISILRIKDEIEFAFTKDGIHVENSPCYHQYVLGVFFKLRSLLNPEEWQKIGTDQIFLNAFKFLVHSSRPDRMLPTIGDSELFPVRNYYKDNTDLHGQTDYENLEYIVSAAEQGLRPEELFFVSSHAGYAFSRNSWDTDATYLSFQCGCRSNYHRQADDLGITLCYNNEDWIIDGGMFNHNRTDPVRKYMRSIHSHSTVYIKGAAIDMNIDHCGSTSLTSDTTALNRSKTKHLIHGTSNMMPGHSCSRSIVHQLSRKEITITDDIRSESNESNTARFRFLIPDDKTISKIHNGFKVSSESGKSMVIQTEFPMDNITLNKKDMSHYSLKLNELKNGQIIDFESTYVGSLQSIIRIYFL